MQEVISRTEAPVPGRPELHITHPAGVELMVVGRGRVTGRRVRAAYGCGREEDPGEV